MLNTQLLTQDQLLEWSGYNRQADLERFLRRNNINYTYGKQHKVCTTQAAIDAVMVSAKQQEQEVEF